MVLDLLTEADLARSGATAVAFHAMNFLEMLEESIARDETFATYLTHIDVIIFRSVRVEEYWSVEALGLRRRAVIMHVAPIWLRLFPLRINSLVVVAVALPFAVLPGSLIAAPGGIYSFRIIGLTLPFTALTLWLFFALSRLLFILMILFSILRFVFISLSSHPLLRAFVLLCWSRSGLRSCCRRSGHA